MEIYQKTGVNYFYDFYYLRSSFRYEKLDNGIKNYSKYIDMFDNEYLDNYLEKISKIIKLMNFFSIDNLYGTSVTQYIEFYNSAEAVWNDLKLEELNKKKMQSEESLDKMKSTYFNFDDFDENKFYKIFKECTKDMDMGKNIYTLDEVININVNFEANKTFIVFLRKDNKVCFVGKTINLLNYIGLKCKEYNADRVAFYPIDNEYIDDIYIKSLIEFDITTGIPVRNTNRKYISLKSAKRVFKDIYKINLNHIKKIIKEYDLEKFIINDSIILDKIELDKATRDYLDLGSR